MAEEQNLGATEEWFVGEDKNLPFEIFDADGVPIDIATWDMRWVLRRIGEADSIVVSKTVGSGILIAGAYNVDPDVNAQLATVSVGADDTRNLPAGQYAHTLKRTDEGSETVLCYGTVYLKKVAL